MTNLGLISRMQEYFSKAKYINVEKNPTKKQNTLMWFISLKEKYQLKNLIKFTINMGQK